ncbi:hypothetical protein PENSPDRAFT_735398 [Peniophora sp. CONT]|nr:hypothetical protein PENSPDRAFT_735398 [Peniophora sp. CONT]
MVSNVSENCALRWNWESPILYGTSSPYSTSLSHWRASQTRRVVWDLTTTTYAATWTVVGASTPTKKPWISQSPTASSAFLNLCPGLCLTTWKSIGRVRVCCRSTAKGSLGPMCMTCLLEIGPIESFSWHSDTSESPPWPLHLGDAAERRTPDCLSTPSSCPY